MWLSEPWSGFRRKWLAFSSKKHWGAEKPRAAESISESENQRLLDEVVSCWMRTEIWTRVAIILVAVDLVAVELSTLGLWRTKLLEELVFPW
jgi:hypothetical protein